MSDTHLGRLNNNYAQAPSAPTRLRYLCRPSYITGKRKKSSRQPQQPRKREPLPSTFACLFCNHENSVIVKLDKKLGLGHLSCKVCGQRFQTGINYLSAAVDVYSDWVDACDAVAKDAANKYEESDAHAMLSSDRPFSPGDRGVEFAE
ncbi:transcription elongation factor 1 family protein [Aspergillus lucknowensis]|uniref:Transcription elongation factor 1 homolog n=1 Tax=Aspergillus lucknowensis TaxID=176173 RepID=A0ABR4LP88_9EURO